MTTELIIQAADNGMMISEEDAYIQVIEDTYEKGGNDKEHIYREFGTIFYELVTNAMNEHLLSLIHI